jgi:SAM-dependent methyltransferase
MSVPPELFDEDYLYFYSRALGDEQSDTDAELLARLLDLQPRMRVLDVPCGEGRIAGRLAARGCDVVGIDLSDLFLDLGRRRWPSVTFQRRDMRSLTYEAEFDAVVNWFTSFGYFDREANDAVLQGFARALRPGGRLLLDFWNPDRVARFVELGSGKSAFVTDRDGDLMADRFSYDPAAGFRTTERFIVRRGRVRKIEFSIEHIPAPQLTERLERAGFREVRLFGRGGGPFEPEGPRLIAVAERGQ